MFQNAMTYRAAFLPPLPVEPRGAPVGSRPVSGAHAAEKMAIKRLQSAAFVRAALLELKLKKGNRSPERVLTHHRKAKVLKLGNQKGQMSSIKSKG